MTRLWSSCEAGHARARPSPWRSFRGQRCEPSAVFHVELRQFPHVARAFNLTPEQLQMRILGAWVRGAAVEMDERRWAPERARLTIYEGPQLKREEMGVGRGWANVTKNCTEVTDQLLALERSQATATGAHGNVAAQAIAELQVEILDRCALGDLALADLVELLSDRHPDWRVSDRIALAEQSIWQLLHRERLTLLRGDGAEPIDKEAWGPVLLRWGTWSREGTPDVFLGLGESDRPENSDPA